MGFGANILLASGAMSGINESVVEAHQLSDEKIIGLKWQNQLIALAKTEKKNLKPYRVFAVE